MREIIGKRTADSLRVIIVVARFNEVLTGQLLEGARKALQGAGVLSDDLTVIHVPGSDEIPLAADAAIRELKPDAVLGLGCVITGETEHARIILEQCSRSLAELARLHGIPVINGIVGAASLELAHERCSQSAGNKGWTAALNAIEMSTVYAAIREEAGS